jgi:hypothetical protein
MTRSIDRLTGRDDCREAVLTHRHPAWASDNPAWAIMVVVVVVLGELELRVAGFAVLVAWLVFVSWANPTVIARTSTHVVFARASRFPMGRRALEIRYVLPHPVWLTTSHPGLLLTVVTANGEQYRLSRLRQARLARVAAGLVAASRGAPTRWPTPEQTALADGGHVVQVSYQGPHQANVFVGGLGSQPVRRRSIRTTTGWILADPAIGA